MTTREALVLRLETLIKDLRLNEQKAKRLSQDRHISDHDRQSYAAIYADDIKTSRQRIVDVVEEYDSIPERFDEYSKHGANFWNIGPKCDFSSSVFMMTKFPEPGTQEADKLKAVIDCIKQALTELGYHPRIAQGATFKDWLWSDVEAHLLFCKHGVAVLEDRYRAELNPNVALEWGWMLGMGRKVIYLREKSFNKERADWLGRISHEFEWDQPAVGVRQAIQNELQPRL